MSHVPARWQGRWAWARPSAFSMPELLVVIGLMMLLLALLAPAMSRARRQAEAIKCRAQLRDLGLALSAYANENRGVVYPYRGEPPPTWADILFDEPGPAVLVCPTGDGEELRSYQLSGWVRGGRVRIAGNNSKGVPASRIVLAGENWLGWLRDFSFVDPATGMTSWDPARHGPGLMSNYLWLDGHVDNFAPPPPGPGDYFDPWYVPTD